MGVNKNLLNGLIDIAQTVALQLVPGGASGPIGIIANKVVDKLQEAALDPEVKADPVLAPKVAEFAGRADPARRCRCGSPQEQARRSSACLRRKRAGLKPARCRVSCNLLMMRGPARASQPASPCRSGGGGCS